MINSITSFASNAYASLPTIKLDTPSNMVKKTTIVLSAITLIGLANFPKASADPFVDCMNNCRRNADNSLALLICQTLCLFANKK